MAELAQAFPSDLSHHGHEVIVVVHLDGIDSLWAGSHTGALDTLGAEVTIDGDVVEAGAVFVSVVRDHDF